RFLLHNIKISKSGRWIVLVQDSCRFDTCSIVPGGSGVYFWDLDAATPSVSKVINKPSGHWTEGFDLFVNQNGDTGVNLNARKYSEIHNPFPLNSFSFPIADTQGFDIHPSWNYNDGSDTTPICTATAGFDWPYTRPWENEVICYGTNPSGECGTTGHAL